MNAATRVLTHNELVIRRETLTFVWPELQVLVMLFLVLVSALAVVYAKDLNRRSFIDYQQLQRQGEQLQISNNNLLLEQSAWSAQARVRRVAEQQLDMQVPASNSVVILKI